MHVSTILSAGDTKKNLTGTLSPENFETGRRKMDADGEARRAVPASLWQGNKTGGRQSGEWAVGWKRFLIEEAPTCLF